MKEQLLWVLRQPLLLQQTVLEPMSIQEVLMQHTPLVERLRQQKHPQRLRPKLQ